MAGRPQEHWPEGAAEPPISSRMDGRHAEFRLQLSEISVTLQPLPREGSTLGLIFKTDSQWLLKFVYSATERRISHSSTL